MMTLEQFCRALAAHLLLGQRPEVLHGFMGPETAEATADFIHRFALGEPVTRDPCVIEDPSPYP